MLIRYIVNRIIKNNQLIILFMVASFTWMEKLGIFFNQGVWAEQIFDLKDKDDIFFFFGERSKFISSSGHHR